MASNIGFNPLITTNAAGLFNAYSDGYYQGVMLDDPVARFYLTQGVLASTETLPMWGGVAIFENIPGLSGNLADSLGSIVGRALTAANISGFSVTNQAYNWITTPQSECPSAAAGMSVPYVRFGSGARISVACDPALASLEGGSVSQQVSWDLNAQQLVQYNAAWNANVLTNAVWSSGSATFTTTSAHGVAVGEYFTISGMTPAGYNGDYKAIAGTAGSTLVGALATNPGAYTVLGTLVAGGGALPCKIIDFQIGNSKIITYDAVNNFVHYSVGSTAVIII